MSSSLLLNHPTLADRARGAFYGLALGDAFGMPTQALSRERIVEQFGRIDKLENAFPDQPIAPGLRAGSITDDTEQAVLVAHLLADGHGKIEPMAFAHALIEWEASMKARGSLDLLGPSTKQAIVRIAAGEDPLRTGRFGTTNGAAMRVTPVGIAFDLRRHDQFIDAVVQSCVVTHNTTLGISSAAAVAAAVSAGLNGASLVEALEAGISMAEAADSRGFWVAGGRIAPRIRHARELMRNCAGHEVADTIYDVIGTSVASQESVVATFALAFDLDTRDSTIEAALGAAASLGGDTDTIAAMLGAILGACAGYDALPAGPIETIRRVNSLDLEPLVDRLLGLRAAAA
ncbi:MULTISPECIES: ADP-ribosylglycohydrolase family protein [unclassified Caballeronia]|jgi:ADP-ribosylglycohydrolase|uniref:ADP-ribosylglycohydrolase family protein n=1 Tax=unclassified Caballeronia TaxID=2646786 RepID=UPI003ECF49F6